MSMNGKGDLSGYEPEGGGQQLQMNRQDLRAFIEAGDSLEDELVRAGSVLEYDDLDDIAEIFRLGLDYRDPRLTMMAWHKLLASQGANGEARLQGMAVAIGQMHGGMFQGKGSKDGASRKGGLFSRMRKSQQQAAQSDVSPTL